MQIHHLKHLVTTIFGLPYHQLHVCQGTTEWHEYTQISLHVSNR